MFRLSDIQIILLCSVCSFIILLIDTSLPLGVAGGVPYIFVVLISLFSARKNFTLFVAIATSVFTLIGYYLSPQGSELWIVLLNRVLALFSIWSVALLGEKLKNTKKEKERKEQEFQQIFDLSPDIIGKGTLDGRFTKINSAITQILGYSKQEFTARPFIEFVHEDDIEDTLLALQAANEGERNIINNNRYLCSDGTYKWLEWNVLAHAEDNVFHTVARDVTERVLAEQKAEVSAQRLAEAQSIAHIGHWQYDNYSDEVICSNEFYRILGICPQTEVTAEYYLSLVHPDDKEFVWDSYKNSVLAQDSFHITHRAFLPDGTLKHISLHGRATFTKENVLLTALGTIHDVTEQVELKNRMLNNQKMDALGKLTGGIAHDFNNMLGIVVGYSEILEKALVEQPTLCNYAKQITRSGRRGAELTDKLLSFAKQKPSSTTCVVINELISESQDIIRKSLTTKITLDLNLAENLWCTDIDKFEFDNMLVNMCINSKHAMPSGGCFGITTKNQTVTVKEAKELTIESGDYVVLSVKDNGSGIPKAMLDKVFDPFFSTKGELGTGLGLSQAYGFIKSSSGHIKVHSSKNKGCEFIIYLPRCYNEKKGSANKAALFEQETHHQDIVTDDKRILIVDDEAALLVLSKKILTDAGYQVFCAESGDQALSILAEQTIDLLLSDIIMPAMNGYQLAEQVQSKYPQVAIVFVSGYQDDLPKQQSEKILSIPLLEKPYSNEKLLDLVAQHLPKQLLLEQSHDQDTGNIPPTGKVSSHTEKAKEIEITQWSQHMVIDNQGIIDQDHQKLLSILTHCQQLNESDVDFTTKMQALIEELTLYTVEHFAAEELAMKVCNYPHLKNHRDIHQLMIKELKVVLKTKTLKEIRQWVITYLSDWLLDHIMVMDKALKPYISDHSEEVQQAMAELIKERSE